MPLSRCAVSSSVNNEAIFNYGFYYFWQARGAGGVAV
jgi:hypothetical protein